jgi:hypothetical protein
MPQTRPQPIAELQAFCTTCPAAQEVSELLAGLGFRLAFQMGEQPDRRGHLPPLPAQYHYKDDACGTEVIFLAGRDTPLEREVFTPHASRFWLYAGADAHSLQRVLSRLSLTYQLAWRDPSEPDTRQEVA